MGSRGPTSERPRCDRQPERNRVHRRDHATDLGLVGRASTRNGSFDERRCVLCDRDTALLCDEERDPAHVRELDRRRGEARKEDALDRHGVGRVLFDERFVESDVGGAVLAFEQESFAGEPVGKPVAGNPEFASGALWAGILEGVATARSVMLSSLFGALLFWFVVSYQRHT